MINIMRQSRDPRLKAALADYDLKHREGPPAKEKPAAGDF
jgi:hypothetical protein